MKHEYIYIGCIEDRFHNILIRDKEFYTVASSVGEARRNILSQAKQRLGLNQSTYLRLTHPENIEILLPSAKFCPECGTRLTDGGYCPNCYIEGDETNYL